VVPLLHCAYTHAHMEVPCGRPMARGARPTYARHMHAGKKVSNRSEDRQTASCSRAVPEGLHLAGCFETAGVDGRSEVNGRGGSAVVERRHVCERTARSTEGRPFGARGVGDDAACA